MNNPESIEQPHHQDDASHNVDWASFLGRHDMTFDKLPTCWQEAPHFGNALIGSMLYMQGERLCLEIFRADVCDHRDESNGWTAYSRPHFRIGYFELETKGTPVGCAWRKDLWNAELTGTLTTDRGELTLRHFTHAGDMAMITELTASQGEQVMGWTWHPVEAVTTRGGYPTDQAGLEKFSERYGEHYLKTLKPKPANPPGRPEQRGEMDMWIQDLMAGGQYATAWVDSGEGSVRRHIVTIANSYPDSTAADEAEADLRKFISFEPEAWLEAHRAWWHAYYPRSFVTIPDTALETDYWRTIYRYGCCSRAGRYYVDTSGLWFQGAQWPYTTNDWNTQSAHWAVYAANRLEQGEEVVNRLHAGRENLVAAVYPEAWREDSAYLHLATAGDMVGTRISDMRYFDCVGCLPWLLHNAWWQYRFSMDDEMLREKIFPLLRRSMNFYLHLTEEGEDGRLHLAPTYSPETEVCKDANFDLALFKWGCHILLKACHRLAIDDPLIPRWQEVTERLVDFPADEKGFRLGSEQTAWDDHRHLSHLLMIYPLYLVNMEQKGTAEVLARSCELAHAGAGSESGGMQELVAMVQAHAGPIATAVGDGDRALKGLKRMQAEFTPTGLWPCNDNPCIESTLTLANTIQEMLIQSWSDPACEKPGPIRIFPALPAGWQDVEFHNLRSEGAFLVSARRRGGKTDWVRIQSLAGEPCRIRPGFEGGMSIYGPRQSAVVETAPGIYELGLKKGEQIVMRAEGA